MAGLGGKFFAAGSSSDEDDERTESEEETSEDESTDSSDESGSESSSDSGSDSDSDSDSDDEGGANRFLAGSDSDSDEDERRVVKSAKDKRLDELSSTIDTMRNKLKINDWAEVQVSFDKMMKEVDKYMKAAEKPRPPRMYLRLLIELEDTINKTAEDKDLKKKFSPTNSKAYNTMRQRLKKLVQTAEVEASLKWLKENPDTTEEEGDEEEESEDESEEEKEDKTVTEEGLQQKKKDKLFTMDPKDITYELVNRKLREIVQSRGKKGTDKQEQVEMLTYLAQVAKGPAQKFEVLGQLVSSLFDLQNTQAGYLKPSLWRKCVINMLEMMRILQENTNITVDEGADLGDERAEEPAPGAEVKVWGSLTVFVERLDDEMFKSLQVIDPHTHEYLTRLKDEPVLNALAQKVADYLARRGDQGARAKICLRLVEHLYYKTEAVYQAMRKLTQAQQDADAAEAAAVEAAQDDEEDHEKVVVKVPSDYVMEPDLTAAIRALTAIIFTHGDERTKARAMLCLTYHKAIHGDYHSARDMLLMSHLQESVQMMDVNTQILYNRTLTQLGMAAFKAGLIIDSFNCLNELYGSGHIKELLAQGMAMSKYQQQEKSAEELLLEKRRQVPFHMHITLELVESVYLTCAMLLEVPNMAAHPLNPKKKMISKQFHRTLDAYNRQIFTGPPENVRDTVMAATKALMRGDWAKAFQYISGLNAWNLLPQKDQVLSMLKDKVKEEALRTYLLTYASQYGSLSLDQLCEMFELPEKRVYSVVSKMMFAEEIAGSWDQPTRTIVMHQVESTRLQQLALQLADKAEQMVSLNERALDFRLGRSRQDDEEEEGGQQQRRRGRQGRGGEGEEEAGTSGRTRGGRQLGALRRGLGQEREGGGERKGRTGGGGRGERGDRGYRRGAADGGGFGTGGGSYAAAGREGGYGGGRRQQNTQNFSSLGNINPRQNYRERRQPQ